MASIFWSPIQNINNWWLWIKKKNALPNLISHQPDINKIYLCAKGPYEAKYQPVINEHEIVGSKQCDDLKAFIRYSNEYNTNKKTENINCLQRDSKQITASTNCNESIIRYWL